MNTHGVASGVRSTHLLIFSMNGHRNNDPLFRVRCACMAQYEKVSSWTEGTLVERARRGQNYDWLALVYTLREANAAFNIHVETGATLVKFEGTDRVPRASNVVRPHTEVSEEES